MTAALTPALALDYITELSADIRTAIVLEAATGTHLAGPEALAAPAHAFLRTRPEATCIQGTTERGWVFAARDDQHAIVVVTGRFALPRVALHDLRTALAALGGQTGPNVRSANAPEAATSAFLHSAQDHFRLPRAV